MTPEGLPTEAIAIIDAYLIDNNLLMAVKEIRERTGLDLHDSGAVMRRRCLHPRENRPGSFVLTDKEYWSGWYT